MHQIKGTSPDLITQPPFFTLCHVW